MEVRRNRPTVIKTVFDQFQNEECREMTRSIKLNTMHKYV